MDFVGKCVKFSSAGDKAIASFDCSGFLLTGTKNVKQNFLASLKSKSCVSSGGGGGVFSREHFCLGVFGDGNVCWSEPRSKSNWVGVCRDVVFVLFLRTIISHLVLNYCDE